MKFLTLATLGLLATTSMVSAQDGKALSQDADTVREMNAYQYEYDRDEQCQGYYWGVKRLGLQDPCEKDDEEVMQQDVKRVEVLNEYVVYFDFDKAGVRANDRAVLQQAAREINNYNPRRVLVAGYTDTRGSMAYNEVLSSKRADNVSNYLNDLGVSNFVVDEEALGETNLAVATADEVKKQENRRVVIQFIR